MHAPVDRLAERDLDEDNERLPEPLEDTFDFEDLADEFIDGAGCRVFRLARVAHPSTAAAMTSQTAYTHVP